MTWVPSAEEKAPSSSPGTAVIKYNEDRGEGDGVLPSGPPGSSSNRRASSPPPQLTGTIPADSLYAEDFEHSRRVASVSRTLLARPEFKQQLVDAAQVTRVRTEAEMVKKQAEVEMQQMMATFRLDARRKKQQEEWAGDSKYTAQRGEEEAVIAREWAEHTRELQRQAAVRREAELEKRRQKEQQEARELQALVKKTRAKQMDEDTALIKRNKEEQLRLRAENLASLAKWEEAERKRLAPLAAAARAEVALVFEAREAELQKVRSTVRSRKENALARKRRADADRMRDYSRRRAEVSAAKAEAEAVAKLEADEEAAARHAQRERNLLMKKQRAAAAAAIQKEKTAKLLFTQRRQKQEQAKLAAETEARLAAQRSEMLAKRKKAKEKKVAEKAAAEQAEINRRIRLDRERLEYAAEQKKRQGEILSESRQAAVTAKLQADETKRLARRQMDQLMKMGLS